MLPVAMLPAAASMLLASLPGAAGARLGNVVLAEAPQHSHATFADFTATTWIAVVLIGIGTMWTVWKAVMYTIHPGEDEPDHLKRLILGEPDPLQVSLSSAGDAGLVELDLDGAGRNPMELSNGSDEASDEEAADDDPAGRRGARRDD